MEDDIVRLLRDYSEWVTYEIECYLISDAKKQFFLVCLHFKLSLHFVPGLQSAVCILYLVCILYPVCSLQSAVCSLHFVLTGKITVEIRNVFVTTLNGNAYA